MTRVVRSKSHVCGTGPRAVEAPGNVAIAGDAEAMVAAAIASLTAGSTYWSITRARRVCASRWNGRAST